MHEEVKRALVAQRKIVCARWEELLRADEVSSPLANPDTLVFRMNSTLQELWESLGSRLRPGQETEREACACGRNPFLSYFRTGSIALGEALRRVHDSLPWHGERSYRENLAKLENSLAALQDREIHTFCAVCLYRGLSADHLPAVPCTRSR